MDILSVASEAVPFCKTGGLADMVSALARALDARGERVAVVLPYYRAVRESGLESRELPAGLRVPLGGREVPARLRLALRDGVSFFLVDCPPLFDRPGLYQDKGVDHPDNAERFAFLCRAALEAAKTAGFRPDAIHCHDWQAALVPAYLKTLYAHDPFFRRSGSVLTVHNAAYQGLFPKAALAAAGLPESEFVPERLEYYGKLNFLKAGLVYADRVSTVSPTYAREVASSAEFGRGLEGVFRLRGGEFSGVLNGLDLEDWDPATDPHLPRRYGAADWARGKAACRAALRAECGLEESSDPLVAVVSRLDPQKGLDLALEAVAPLLDRVQFAAIGTGDPVLQRGFSFLAARRPKRAYHHATFDDGFARRLYAAADLFLMPSRFEPCGLGQMIAMRYGALPVAVKTGGLADTVFEEGPGANGFLAPEASAPAVAAALERALAARGAWEPRVRRAMAADFSWTKPVEDYLALYAAAAARRGHEAAAR